MLRRFEPAIEALYREFRSDALRTRVRWSLGSASAVMALYGLLDLLIMPREVLAEVLALRYGLMVLPLTAALALSFHPRLRPYQQSMSAAAAMLCGVAVVTMLTLSRLRGVPIPYEGILLVMM